MFMTVACPDDTYVLDIRAAPLCIASLEVTRESLACRLSDVLSNSIQPTGTLVSARACELPQLSKTKINQKFMQQYAKQ
jgi:hypothetical protein